MIQDAVIPFFIFNYILNREDGGRYQEERAGGFHENVINEDAERGT